MPLDEYLPICASPISGPIDVEATIEGLATVLGEFTKRLEAVEPPAEVADWHDAVLVYQKALKKALDESPGPDNEEAEDLYLLTVVFPAVLPHQAAIDAAISGMAQDVYARLVEAGCIDEEGFGFGDDTPGGGRIITEFAFISVGADHTCGVGTDGFVGCWGEAWSGRTLPPDAEFSSVSAGEYHTCGVMTDGTVVCWGSDDNGKTTPPDGAFSSVSAGDDHTCGVRVDGPLACWDDDFFDKDGLLFGSGWYQVLLSSPLDVTKADPAEYTVAVVDRAIRYHKAHGRAEAVQYYNTPESVDGNWYVFVVDENEELIAHRDSSLLGKHIDEVGNTIDGRRFSELEITEAGRWVDYVFVNPATGEEGIKHSWVMRHDGLIIGSGWYE